MSAAASLGADNKGRSQRKASAIGTRATVLRHRPPSFDVVIIAPARLLSADAGRRIAEQAASSGPGPAMWR